MIGSCDTSAFSPVTEYSNRNAPQINQPQAQATLELSSDQILENLSDRFGEDAKSAVKADGSIDYQVVQALFESNALTSERNTHASQNNSIYSGSGTQTQDNTQGQLLNIQV